MLFIKYLKIHFQSNSFFIFLTIIIINLKPRFEACGEGEKREKNHFPIGKISGKYIVKWY